MLKKNVKVPFSPMPKEFHVLMEARISDYYCYMEASIETTQTTTMEMLLKHTIANLC